MDILTIWTIAIVILLAILIGSAVYLWLRQRNQHWQVGYLTLRTNKPGQAPRYDTGFGEPVWGQQNQQQQYQQTQYQSNQSPQQNQNGDVRLPPGMF